MDIFDKAVLMARTARVMTRLEGMKVENMRMIKAGCEAVYRGPDFDVMLQEEDLAEPVKEVTPAEKADHALVIARLETAVRDIINRVSGNENDFSETDDQVKQGVEEIFKALTEVKS